jgi:DNA end-binding protein Ku
MLRFVAMSARAISSATISFGLVSIPVKVYSSGESSAGVHFHMLHGECGSRLKQQYWCPKHERVVERAEIVRGYEHAKNQYVLFSEEELKALQEAPTQSVEITEFLPTEKVDPVYFEKAYYLGPDKGGDRAYKLLTAALKKSGRSAVAKYAARGKQYLVLLRPVEGALVMQQLRYADELRPISEVPLGDAVVRDAELELALQIIDQGIADEFKPEAYEDEVRRRMLALIEKKVLSGQEITAEPVASTGAQVIDLMEALKKSLAAPADSERKPAKRAEAGGMLRAAKKSAVKKRSRG